VRRQIVADEIEEERVVNIHKQRLRKPFLERWKEFIKEWPDIFYLLKDDGKFESTRMLEQLGLE